MSYRYMRMLVFFDLPMTTQSDLREYRQFRKHLINSGFYMLQESVYCKLALNKTAANAVKLNLIKNQPSSGIVQLLMITEKQFLKMEYLVGEGEHEQIDSDERMIVL